MLSTSLLPIIPLLASLVGALPLSTRQSSFDWPISATFIGAADAQYDLDMAASSSYVPMSNPLSVSQIRTSSDTDPCVFFGIDGAIIFVPGSGGLVDVGPPQGIVGGKSKLRCCGVSMLRIYRILRVACGVVG